MISQLDHYFLRFEKILLCFIIEWPNRLFMCGFEDLNDRADAFILFSSKFLLLFELKDFLKELKNYV